MSEDYADLFCELFDGLAPAEFRSAGEGWIRDARVLALAAAGIVLEDTAAGVRWRLAT